MLLFFYSSAPSLQALLRPLGRRVAPLNLLAESYTFLLAFSSNFGRGTLLPWTLRVLWSGEINKRFLSSSTLLSLRAPLFFSSLLSRAAKSPLSSFFFYVANATLSISLFSKASPYFFIYLLYFLRGADFHAAQLFTLRCNHEFSIENIMTEGHNIFSSFIVLLLLWLSFWQP